MTRRRRDGERGPEQTARVTLETGLPGIERREVAPGVHEVSFSPEAAEELFPPRPVSKRKATRTRWSLDGPLPFVSTAAARRRHGMTLENLAELTRVPVPLLAEFEDPHALAEPDRRDQTAIVAAFAGAESIETLFPMTLDDTAPASASRGADVDQAEQTTTRPPRTVDAAAVQSDAVEQGRAELAAEAAGIRKDLERVSLREGVENFKRRVRRGS